MSTFTEFLALELTPNAAPALGAAYGEGPTGGDAGVSTIPVSVSGYDFVTLRLGLTAISGGLDQLDIRPVHMGVPTEFDPLSPGRDPTDPTDYAAAVVDGLLEPQDMTIQLRPSDLSKDLEFSVTGIAARTVGAAFSRDLTIDVRGLSMLTFQAKSPAGTGTLALSILPHATGAALAAKATRGY